MAIALSSGAEKEESYGLFPEQMLVTVVTQ